MEYRNPQYLTDTDWLIENLDRGDLRIFDCTTYLTPHPEKTYSIESGRRNYDGGHIPGSGFIDLQNDLSDRNSRLRFTLPSESRFEQAAGKLGVDNDSTVILYSATSPIWATRVWWMFRVFGHKQVSVLNGGLTRWRADGHRICDVPCGYPEAKFTASLDKSGYADMDRVKAAILDKDTCIINSLSREQHRGGGVSYGRPGRIQGSTALPAAELVDQETGMFLPAEELNNALESVGALGSDKVITYCGGGIAASTDLFALALMGKEAGVALYDGSLGEWAASHDAPMESDQ